MEPIYHDVQKMLAELDGDLVLKAAPLPLEADPRELLEELELEAAAMRSAVTTTEKHVPQEIIPFIVALRLQKAGCDWQTVTDFTTYLFSEGPDGYKAQQEKNAYVQRVEAELAELVKYTAEEEKKCDIFEREKCIVVNNISADADIEDLERVFAKYAVDTIFMLDERHPTNRTKAAYVQLMNTESMEYASRHIARIFGLKLYIRRAADMFKDASAMNTDGKTVRF